MPSTSVIPLATPVVATCTVASADGLGATPTPVDDDGWRPPAGAQPKVASPATAAAEPPMNWRREMRGSRVKLNPHRIFREIIRQRCPDSAGRALAKTSYVLWLESTAVTILSAPVLPQ